MRLVTSRNLITTRKAGTLWVRKPGWLEADAFSIRVDEDAVEPLQIGEWAVIPSVAADRELDIRYSVPRREDQEWVYDRLYRVSYEGDTVVAMSPRGRYAPMYPEVPGPSLEV